MKLLILEPPYSRLFHDLTKELKPSESFVHLFNIGYLLYLPQRNFFLVKKAVRDWSPREDSVLRVQGLRNLANSNTKKPEAQDLRIMASYMEYLEKFVADQKITLIICHNDLRWQHAIAKDVAQRMGIPIFFSEDGLFRPHTMTFDPKGVNAYSSVPKAAVFYRQKRFQESPDFRPLETRQARRIVRLFYFLLFLALNKIGDLFSLNTAPKNKEYLFWTYVKLFLSKLRSARAGVAGDTAHRGFIFVPLQVTNDTQTIIHSDFNGTQDFIRCVERSYASLPSDVRRHHPLVFKKHPMEAHVEYAFDQSSIVTDEPTSILLRHCSLVVLINSTTITEALSNHKRIIALGNSQYEVEGLLTKSTKERLAADVLERLQASEQPDPLLVASFLNFLKYHYQINGNIFYYDRNVLKQLKERINAS